MKEPQDARANLTAAATAKETACAADAPSTPAAITAMRHAANDKNDGEGLKHPRPRRNRDKMNEPAHNQQNAKQP